MPLDNRLGACYIICIIQKETNYMYNSNVENMSKQQRQKGDNMTPPQQLHSTQALEDIAIQQALKNGHLNPREDEDQVKCLWADGANRKILQYKVVDVNSLSTNNPRFNDVDVSYNRSDLGPLIIRHREQKPESFGFEYPIMVVARGTKYEITHGHNRLWCAVHILRLTGIPVFIIEDTGDRMQSLIGRISPNCKRSSANRQYRMEDIIEQMKEFRLIGYFTNLGCPKQTREEFEQLMNKVHPNQFIDRGPRGKIFKNFYTNRTMTNSSIVPIDDSFWDSITSRSGYPSRQARMISNKRKKIEFPHYVCDKNNAIIIYAADNQSAIESLLFKFQLEWKTNKEYREKYKNYDLHLIFAFRPNKVKTTETEMDKKRRDKIVELNGWNQVLSDSSTKISKVIFPIQLTVEKTDKVFVFDPESNQLTN
jgi:hypothetical protein